MKDQAKGVRAGATIASSIWVALAFLISGQLSETVDKVVSFLPAAIGFGLVIFDLWAWRLPVINGLTGRPKIGGTWNAVITPSDASAIPEGGTRGPIAATLIIEQTFWSLHVRLHTRQGSSFSTVAALSPQGDSRNCEILTYSYSNEPDPSQRPRSNPHSGTCKIVFTGREPKSASGAYWTDRLSAGSMEIAWIDKGTDRSRADCLLLTDE